MYQSSGKVAPIVT